MERAANDRLRSHGSGNPVWSDPHPPPDFPCSKHWNGKDGNPSGDKDNHLKGCGKNVRVRPGKDDGDDKRNGRDENQRDEECRSCEEIFQLGRDFILAVEEIGNRMCQRLG
jgi:hypothetical protein